MLALVLCLGLAAGANAASSVSTIDISSDWGGLGNAQSTSVHITHKADGYTANGASISAKYSSTSTVGVWMSSAPCR